MNCKHITRHLSDYLDGKLDASLRQEVDAHCMTCARCREELALLKTYHSDMHGLNEVKAPVNFLEHVHARLEHPPQKKYTFLKNLLHTLFVPWWQKIPLEFLGTSAAVFVGMIVFHSLHSTHHLPPSPQEYALQQHEKDVPLSRPVAAARMQTEHLEKLGNRGNEKYMQQQLLPSSLPTKNNQWAQEVITHDVTVTKTDTKETAIPSAMPSDLNNDAATETSDARHRSWDEDESSLHDSTSVDQKIATSDLPETSSAFPSQRLMQIERASSAASHSSFEKKNERANVDYEVRCARFEMRCDRAVESPTQPFTISLVITSDAARSQLTALVESLHGTVLSVESSAMMIDLPTTNYAVFMQKLEHIGRASHSAFHPSLLEKKSVHIRIECVVEQ